jgi:hypothetical protein
MSCFYLKFVGSDFLSKLLLSSFSSQQFSRQLKMFRSHFCKHDGRHFSNVLKRKKEERERDGKRERDRNNEVAILMTEKRDRQTDWVEHWPCQRSGRCWKNMWKAKFGWRTGLEEGSNKFNLIFCVEKMNVFFKIFVYKCFLSSQRQATRFQ